MKSLFLLFTENFVSIKSMIINVVFFVMVTRITWDFVGFVIDSIHSVMFGYDGIFYGFDLGDVIKNYFKKLKEKREAKEEAERKKREKEEKKLKKELEKQNKKKKATKLSDTMPIDTFERETQEKEKPKKKRNKKAQVVSDDILTEDVEHFEKPKKKRSKKVEKVEQGLESEKPRLIDETSGELIEG